MNRVDSKWPIAAVFVCTSHVLFSWRKFTLSKFFREFKLIWERIYSPKSEYAHVMCDIFRGYPTNEDKIFTTFCKKKKETEVMHSLAPALTLTLIQTFSLNHLANKQPRSSHSLYSLINSSATDLRTAPC